MKWSTIRILGNVKYFNASYLIILIVPLLADLKNDLPIVNFPITLKLAYYASLAYALAIAFYQIFCPKIIRQYATQNEYIKSNLELHMRAFPDKKQEITLSNLTETQTEIKERIVRLNNQIKGFLNPEKKEILQKELDKLIEEQYPSCIQRYLIGTYEIAQHKNWIATYLAGLLYIVGTAILLYLLFNKTIDVIDI